MTDSYSRASVTAITLVVELIIAAGALVQALLGIYLLITQALTDLAPAWPSAFTRATHALLWPFAALARTTPADAGPGMVVLAMALYLSLTVAAVGAVNLLTRPAPSGSLPPRDRP